MLPAALVKCATHDIQLTPQVACRAAHSRGNHTPARRPSGTAGRVARGAPHSSRANSQPTHAPTRARWQCEHDRVLGCRAAEGTEAAAHFRPGCSNQDGLKRRSLRPQYHRVSIAAVSAGCAQHEMRAYTRSIARCCLLWVQGMQPWFVRLRVLGHKPQNRLHAARAQPRRRSARLGLGRQRHITVDRSALRP
jgi:hypothetical protein